MDELAGNKIGQLLNCQTDFTYFGLNIFHKVYIDTNILLQEYLIKD